MGKSCLWFLPMPWPEGPVPGVPVSWAGLDVVSAVGKLRPAGCLEGDRRGRVLLMVACGLCRFLRRS